MKYLPVLLSSLAALAAVVTTGCFSLDVAQEPPTKHQYLLAIAPPLPADGAGTGAAEAAVTDQPLLQVSKAFVAAPFHEKSLVYRIGDNKYTADYYQEFLVSPSQMITQLTVDWLRTSGAWPRVDHVGAPTTGRILDLTVRELYGDYRREGSEQAVVRLRAQLSSLDAEDNTRRLMEKDYVARVKIKDREAETLVSGLNQALEQVLEKLAADLRSQRTGSQQ